LSPRYGNSRRQDLVDATPVEIDDFKAPTRDVNVLADRRQVSQV
jgi:hypothetical protein